MNFQSEFHWVGIFSHVLYFNILFHSRSNLLYLARVLKWSRFYVTIVAVCIPVNILLTSSLSHKNSLFFTCKQVVYQKKEERSASWIDRSSLIAWLVLIPILAHVNLWFTLNNVKQGCDTCQGAQRHFQTLFINTIKYDIWF